MDFQSLKIFNYRKLKKRGIMGKDYCASILNSGASSNFASNRAKMRENYIL